MLLKSLTEAMGPSGFETEIRDIIRSEVSPYADKLYTDVLGTVYAEKGMGQQGPVVMLDAHMDEVGMMIVHVEENGLLKFKPLGGLDARVLVSKPVRIGKEKRYGVIGSKPIHLQKASERRKPIPMNKLYIDIGAKDKADALKYVKPGDVAMFATEYQELGDHCAKGKSFDDRVGCAVLVETLKKAFDTPVVGAFTVQEEVGLLGATVAGHRIGPDIAIALEATVCSDVVGVPKHGEGTVLGKGPALTVQDSRTLADRRFLEFMMATAEKHDIPYQLRRVKGGSNDYGAIHQTRAGVIGGGISLPLRYMHAPTQLISLDDYENTIRLVEAVVRAIAEGGFQV